eukprot:112241_1
MSSVKKIDKALYLYYKTQITDYKQEDYFQDNVGKFEIFCQDNGFEDNDVGEELRSGDADDCVLLDFDDHFPLPENITDKNSAIYKILKHCLEYGVPPSHSLGPHISISELFITAQDGNNEFDKRVNETKNIYKSLCPELEKHISNDHFWRVATVGRLNNHLPLTVLLADSYSRDRIQCYLRRDKFLTIKEWVETSPITKNAKKHHEDIINTLNEYFLRYNSKISFAQMKQINESIERFSAPVLAMTALVNQIIDWEGVTPLPFQADLMIIPPLPVNNTDDADFDDNDDNDDDDDVDDDTDDNGDVVEQKRQDIIGNIEKRLKYQGTHPYATNKEEKSDVKSPRNFSLRPRPLPTGRGNDPYESDSDEEKNDFHDDATGRKIKFNTANGYLNVYQDLLSQLFQSITDIHKQRFCLVVDLREEKTSVHMYQPSTSKVINNVQLVEYLMQLSYDCVLPGNTKLQNMVESNTITGRNAESQVFILSYQVIAQNKVRCYWYREAQISRFMPDDIVELWPLYFRENDVQSVMLQLNQDKEQSQKKQNYKLVDEEFDQFYEPLFVVLKKRTTEIIKHPTIKYIMQIVRTYLKWNQDMRQNKKTESLEEVIGASLTHVINKYHEAINLITKENEFETIEELEAIVDLCRKNDPNTNIKNSFIVERHYSNTPEKNNELYYDLENECDIVYMSIMDAIYIYFNFSFELCKFTVNEIKEIERAAERKYDKDTNPLVLTSSQLIKMQQISLRKHMVIAQSPAKNRDPDRYKTTQSAICVDKPGDDSSDSSSDDESDDDERDEYKTNYNEPSDMSVYSFSERFFYWKRFKDEKLYVTPKYKNLKEEILKPGHKDKCKWQTIVQKAVKLLESDKIKSLKPGKLHDKFIEEYGLNKEMKFALDHMIAIVLYTDETDLQKLFSQSFRFLETDQSLEDLKSRNSMFAHWSKCFRESVEVFGQSMGSKPVWHGVNKCLLFSDTIATFCSPTSTTTLSNIALNFADDKGLVLKLRKYDEIHCFDVSEFSAFGWENERLFVGGYNPLRIISIFVNEMGIYHDNDSAVPVITSLRELILGKGKNILKEKGLPWLFGLIENSVKLMCGSNDSKDSDNLKLIKCSKKWDYSSGLWKCWSKNVRGTIVIDFALIVDKYKQIVNPLAEKSLIFTRIKKCNNNIWVEPQSLCSICPNATR